VDLILWRHADAEDGADDAARKLTGKGRKQAERMAQWLERHLPQPTRVIVSPAVRAQQTAEALSRDFATNERVNTGASPADVLEAAGWPSAKTAVVVVGHQPTLGAAAALALTGKPLPWHLSKGAIWWLRSEADGEAVVVAVLPPQLV
jgi:phosphohistidine phosphatase